MKIIGLTGGIGSGKSTVAQIFKSLGIPVYESDEKARHLMNTDPGLKHDIIQLFGTTAYTDQELDRNYIAEKVFNNKTLLEKLNAIVHPAVKRDAMLWAAAPENMKAPYVLKESAILFEENLVDELTAVILVVASEAARIGRVMKRDNIPEEKVKARMQHQWPDSKKIPLADYVIFNDDDRSLLEQVTDIDTMIRTQIAEAV